MHWLDWTIVIFVITTVSLIAIIARKLTKSVADFLAAGRTAGRYLLSISGGAAGVGAVSMIAMYEMYYEAGFTPIWWSFMMLPVGLIIACSGWIIYRYRQTLAMTMGQFFEMRYSCSFRIFMGFLSFVSGIVNFGIFPAIGARFFMYFCGLPITFSILGLQVSTYVAIMLVLISFSLWYALIGGQVTVMIADFVQGLICSILFIVVSFSILYIFKWEQIGEVIMSAGNKVSLINPSGAADKDFNMWFFIISVVGAFYNYLSWGGSQGFNCSAKSPHEAKMANIINTFRPIGQMIFTLLIPIAAYILMHHEAFISQANHVRSILAGIGNDTIAKQVTVPLALREFLPIGIAGSVCAIMFVTFITTADTYMHSWGSVFIQDVVMPLCKKPFSPTRHQAYLRLSIAGVAAFIFMFSLLFRQTQYILMFFAITGAIYCGGSGAVIVGGLYWKRGTTAGAWAAMVVGSVLAVSGIILYQIDSNFPINGQWIWAISMAASSFVYIAVSLLGKRVDCNLDRILKRDLTMDATKLQLPAVGWRAIGMGREFSKGDKIIYILSLSYVLGMFGMFIGGTIYNIILPVSDKNWFRFWGFYVWGSLILAVIVAIWVGIGGLRDLKYMVCVLKSKERDNEDSGWVCKRNI